MHNFEFKYDVIYLYILVEKYGQSKLGQNYIFLNGSYIAGRREYSSSNLPSNFM